MPKVNLLTRKKQQLRRKIAAEGVVYLIVTRRNNKRYYVNAVNPDTRQVTWTSIRSNAMMFHTEAGTQHFVHLYMKNRKDVQLIETRSDHA